MNIFRSASPKGFRKQISSQAATQQAQKHLRGQRHPRLEGEGLLTMWKMRKKRDLPCSGEPDGLLDRPGTGLQRPPCLDVSSCSISSSPALFWKRLMRLTTRGDMCVRTQGCPPYGLMGKTWDVPRSVLTTTQRQSWLNEMSCTCGRERSQRRAHLAKQNALSRFKLTPGLPGDGNKPPRV